MRRGIASRWLIGPMAATVVLIVLGFEGFQTSPFGLVIGGALASTAGAGAAALVDSRGWGRHAAIVAAYIAVILSTYLLVLFQLAEPGGRGGPNLLPPP